MKNPKLLLIAFLLIATDSKAGGSLPEFAITSGELQRAALVANPGTGCSFEIILAKKKAVEFTVFTKNNLKKQVVISLNGKPIASPVIMEPIEGEMMGFSTGNELKKYYDFLLEVSSLNAKKTP